MWTLHLRFIRSSQQLKGYEPGPAFSTGAVPDPICYAMHIFQAGGFREGDDCKKNKHCAGNEDGDCKCKGGTCQGSTCPSWSEMP